MTTPPQFSPDGQWWWDGTRWVPAAQAPQPPAQPEPPADQPEPAAAQPAPFQAQAPWPTAAPQQQLPPYGAPLPPKSDGKAIGSLIASVLWFCGVGSVVGVVLGHLSRSQARREGRPPAGLAMAGLVLGYLGLAAMIVVVALVVAFRDPLVHSAKKDAELLSASDAQQSFHRATGRYSSSLEELRAYGYDDFDGTVDVVVIRATATDYCMTTTILGQHLYVSDQSPRPSSRSCR